MWDGANNRWVVTFSVMGFSGFFATTNTNALPVTLVSFTARAQDNFTVAIDWSTSAETLNKGFLVERTKDLKAYEKVGEVNEVSADSKALKTYHLLDQTPYFGTSYYRLTQVDLSGKATVYPAVAVVLRNDTYGVFPNPVVSEGRFSLRLDEPETAIVNFYNTGGQSVPLLKVGIQSGNLVLKPVGKLAAGVYMLTVEERGQVRQHRIIIE